MIMTAYTGAAEAAKSDSICAVLKKAIDKGTPSKKLDQYFSAQWKYLMTEYPEWATDTGYPGQNDRWSDQSLTAITRRKNELKCQLDILKALSPAGLKGEERVSYELEKR